MGASNFTYAEVVEGEDLHSWIGAHKHGFGGVPHVFVPDNLKSGVTGRASMTPV